MEEAERLATLIKENPLVCPECREVLEYVVMIFTERVRVEEAYTIKEKTFVFQEELDRESYSSEDYRYECPECGADLDTYVKSKTSLEENL